MLKTKEIQDRTAVVIPIYFSPDVPRETICSILEGTFSDQFHYCRSDRVVAVVDRGMEAESVLKGASSKAPYFGVPIVILEKNRAKTGAVAKGLQYLLEETDAEFFVTRDCDGDHVVEDIPRMVTMAAELRCILDTKLIGVMGGRPSLEKPMGWVREEWETLTNRILVDFLKYRMAGLRMVPDERFWSGGSPDIQSGYRVYTRAAARLAVECLEALPEDRSILSLACEFVTFAEIVRRGGVFGQVQRLTLVEQPVSSFSQLDFANDYGSLLSFIADRLEIPREIQLQIFDNHLPESSLFFSEHRSDFLRCRKFFQDQEDPPVLARFL